MKTYKTYQKAKIDNPYSDIYTKSGMFNMDRIVCGLYEGWEKCNPADYCITVADFLEAGNKFEVGDLVLEGRIKEMTTPAVTFHWNEIEHKKAIDAYVLRAKALEKPNPDDLDGESISESELVDLSIQDDFTAKPVRTNIEYVKCEYGGKASNIVMDFENDVSLYKMVNDEYWIIDELDDLFSIILDGGEHIYRKIETTMTERDIFIEEACKIMEQEHKERREYIVESLYDSGKFKLVRN